MNELKQIFHDFNTQTTDSKILVLRFQNLSYINFTSLINNNLTFVINFTSVTKKKLTCLFKLKLGHYNFQIF